MTKRITITLIFLFISQLSFAGSVNRAIFTSSVENREPVDQFTTAPADAQKVTFFTDLRSFNGEKITHQWVFNDAEQYSRTFNVGGPRWRVWSSKRMVPRSKGIWSVNVLDANGEIVSSASFEY